jgi:iron complex outermembrane receptor protein
MRCTDPGTWDRAVPFGREALLLAADTDSANTGASFYGVAALSALDERLHVLGGFARHRLRNLPAHNYVTGTVTSPTRRAAGVPQLGGLFRASREVSFFAEYSESFLANNSLLRVNSVPTTPASPAVGRGWEGGVKLELFEGRVSGTVSAYALAASPTGIITVTTGVDASGTTLFSDLQGGRQRSRGVEAELLLTPVDGLQVMLSYGLCDAVYVRHPTNPALDGSRLVATPDQVANLWCKYTAHRRGPHRYYFGGGINYVGATPYVGNNPDVRLPSYATVDLMVGYELDLAGREWSLELAVKNITDRRYYPAGSTWGFPRHAILSARTRF